MLVNFYTVDLERHPDGRSYGRVAGNVRPLCQVDYDDLRIPQEGTIIEHEGQSYKVWSVCDEIAPGELAPHPFVASVSVALHPMPRDMSLSFNDKDMMPKHWVRRSVVTGEWRPGE